MFVCFPRSRLFYFVRLSFILLQQVNCSLDLSLSAWFFSAVLFLLLAEIFLGSLPDAQDARGGVGTCTGHSRMPGYSWMASPRVSWPSPWCLLPCCWQRIHFPGLLDLCLISGTPRCATALARWSCPEAGHRQKARVTMCSPPVFPLPGRSSALPSVQCLEPDLWFFKGKDQVLYQWPYNDTMTRSQGLCIDFTL